MGSLKLSKKVAIVFIIASFIYIFVHSYLFSKEHEVFFMKTLSQYFYLILGIDIIGVISIHKLTNKEEENKPDNILKKNSTDDFYRDIFRETSNSDKEFPTENNTKDNPMKYVSIKGEKLIEE